MPRSAWQWIGGVVATFVALTVVLGVVILVTISTLSGSETELGSGDFDDGASGMQFFAWAASFAWTGHIGLSYEGASGSGDAGVTGPFGFWALLALGALGVSAWWLTRRFRPTSRRSLYAQVGMATIACLLVLLIVGLVGRFSEEQTTMSALGFGATLRAVALVAVALLVGIAASVPRGQRVEALLGHRVRGWWWSMGAGLDVAVCHVAAWLAIGPVIGFIAAIVVREDFPFGLSLAYLSTAGPFMASVAHLGAVKVEASGQQNAFGFLPSELGQEVTAALWTDGMPWAAWLLPIIAVVVIAALAARLTLLRRPGANVDLRHLMLTAGSFLLAWFVIIRVLGVISTGLSYEYEFEGGGGSLSIGPAWWTFAMLLLTGVAVELVHAFVGVQLIQRLPAGLLRHMTPHPHPEWAQYLGGHAVPVQQDQSIGTVPAKPKAPSTVTHPVVGHEEYEPLESSASVDTPGDGAPPQVAGGTWGEPSPMSGRTKAALATLFGAVMLIGVGWFVLGQVDKRYFGPESVALDYASAVVDGNAQEAAEVGRMNIANDDRLLLTNEVYSAAGNRPTSAEVVDVVESEDAETATVWVEFEQNGERYTQPLVAERAGRTLLFFSDWKLQPVTLGTANITVMSGQVEVNGQTLDVSEVARPGDQQVAPLGTDVGQVPGYRLSVPALPGTYTFDIPSTKYADTDPIEVRVSGDPMFEEGAPAQEERTLVAQPSQEFVDEVNKQVAAKIDTCIKDYAAHEPCPFSSTYLDEEGMSTPTFSIDEYPKVVTSETDTIQEGTGLQLDLEGDSTVTEKARCTQDVWFMCDKGEYEVTTNYVDTSGWTAVVTGDAVEVSWTDDFGF